MQIFFEWGFEQGMGDNPDMYRDLIGKIRDSRPMGSLNGHKLWNIIAKANAGGGGIDNVVLWVTQGLHQDGHFNVRYLNLTYHFYVDGGEVFAITG